MTDRSKSWHIRWREEIALGSLVVAIFSFTFFAYVETLGNEFLFWDDDIHVTAQPGIQSLGPQNLYWMWTTFEADNWHPLAWMSHAVDYALFGLEPWGHHLTSVLLHCANTLWLFALVVVLLQWVRTPERPARRWPIERRTLVAAGVASLLFGVHPQHVESVAWVAERKDVLCLFFLFPSVLSYWLYTRATPGRAQRGWYAAALTCAFFALASKPMAVTLPALLLLMDVYPLERLSMPGRGPGEYRVGLGRILVEKIPFVVLSLAVVAATLLAQDHAIASLEQRSLGFRLFHAVSGVGFVLEKFLYPLHLSPVYPPPPGFQGLSRNLAPFTAWLAALLLVTLVFAYLWRRKQYPWLAAWLFYLVALAPVSGIVQIGSQISADRYAYLPTLPFYVLAGVGASRIQRRLAPPLRIVAILSFLLVCLSLIHLTRQQTGIWRNDKVFWSHVVAFAPHYAYAQSALAHSHLLAGEHADAIPHYQKARELGQPRFGDAVNLAVSYRAVGRHADALETLRGIHRSKLDRGQPDLVPAKIAAILCETGRQAEAKTAASQALRFNPGNWEAKAILSQVRSGACR